MVQSFTYNMKKRNKIADAYTVATFVATAGMAVAKWCGWIGWSWWWVTAPIWITLLLAVALVVGANVYFKHLKDYE